MVPPAREHMELAGRKSVDWTAETLAFYDAVLISTNHDGLDMDLLVKHAPPVVATRDALHQVSPGRAKVVKA